MRIIPQTVSGWMPPPPAAGSGETVTRLHGADVEVLVVDLAGVPEPTLHTHDIEQIVIVLDGAVRFNVGGAEHDLRAGDVVVVPPHVLHGAASAGPVVGRLLEVRRASAASVAR